MSDVVLVDATALVALGSVGRVDLLEHFDGEICVPELVAEEVTTEPAETNMDAFFEDKSLREVGGGDLQISEAQEILGDNSKNGDVQMVMGLIHMQNVNREVAVVSDDRRVRNVARGLGATVTGTVGVVVRAVHEGMPAEDAKDLVRDVDSHGLHMTGELREKAFELIDEAAGD